MTSDNKVIEMKSTLEPWRELVIHMDNILSWKQDWHPAISAGSITIIFTVLWYCDPPFVTVASLLLLLLTLLDYAGPRLLPMLFNPDMWSGQKEAQLERISQDLVNLSTLMSSTVMWCSQKKSLSPNLHFSASILSLLALAWLGSMFSGVCLVYFTLMFVIMLPGLHKRGLLEKYCKSAVDKVRLLIKRNKLE